MTENSVNDAQAPAVRATRTHELRLQVAILSVQSEVTNVVSMISGWLISHKVEQEIVAELELVLAEALNNVVEHAYLYREDGEIELLITLDDRRLKARITDSGREFDGPPPLKEMNVEDCEFEELPEGGFGWNLIRTLTDDVEFEHQDHKNRLTLTRNLQIDPAA